jgi:peptidoglycan hydrolase-like protein with peptidoglycan-binding domain
MPLVSNQFKDNNALQQCLVSDPHHVALGAQGEHVARIQQALIMLGAAVIPASEIAAERYGPRTASAVLAYKTKRKIINQTYQSTPDDIVGKKTIERLDLEMKTLEETPPSRFVATTKAGAPHDHSLCPRLEGEDGHIGTPINPLRFGRMINIFGDHETDYLGFEDFITDPQFQSRTSGPPANLTFAPPALGGLPDNCASDICMRSSPVTDAAFTQRTGKPNTIDEIKRIAMSGSRFTYSGGQENINQFGAKVLRLGALMERVEIKTFLTNSTGIVGVSIIIAFVITIF